VVATREPQILARLLLAAAFIVFVVLVANSPARIIYDERYFIKDLPLLHEHGLTPTFLTLLSGAVGPLYAIVHAAFEPLTHLHPVGMRLVTVFLLILLSATLLFSFRRFDTVDPWVAAGSVLIVPMTWVLSGIALSEMPAMVFVGLSLYCQLRGLEHVENRLTCRLWFAASAVTIGVAVWGRQPYLLLAGIPVLLALLDRRFWPTTLIFVAVVMVLTVPLFIIWHGLTPPSHLFFQKFPLSFGNILVSLSYIGICLLLLEPTLIWPERKILVGLFVVLTALNAAFSLSVVHPFRQVVDRLLPESLLPVYGVVSGAVSLTLGVGTFLFLCRAVWRDRADLRRVSIGMGLLGLAVWPALTGPEYSSRYTAMCLPYLLLMAEPWRRWNLGTVAAAAVGCALGAVSLRTYYM
jgi:hypothetical protein